LRSIFGIGNGKETPAQPDAKAESKPAAKAEPASAAAAPVTLPALYPDKDGQNFAGTKFEREVDVVLEGIFQGIDARISEINDPELSVSVLPRMKPGQLEETWAAMQKESFWPGQSRIQRSVPEIYALSLQHSPQVRSASKTPLIQESALAEAKGPYELSVFADADMEHTDEPTGTLLATGRSGRFIQDKATGEFGLRKMLMTGGEVRLGNRVSTLDNNSDFLEPNPQTGSGVTLSLVQPILTGGGYNYHRSIFRLAELNTELAAAAYLRGLETHLLTVNRAYWGVSLARAAFMQRQEMVKETKAILGKLEERGRLDADATYSEKLRAQAALKQREADLARTKMEVRIAEERLRAVVNDPALPMGAAGEFIPVTRPRVAPPWDDAKSAVLVALHNRAEIIQAGLNVRSATIRYNQARKDLNPQFDLIAEMGYAGLDSNRDLSGAYSDMTRYGAEWRAGFRFSQTLERGAVKAKLQRRELEYQQAIDDLEAVSDQIRLETLVRFREMLSAYQDMVGQYEALAASRENLVQLRDRLDLDTDDPKRTVSYQLQLILDSMDRNKQAEEAFLVSVVTYNTSLEALEQAKGTFLQFNSVEILREESEDRGAPDTLKASLKP